MILSGEGVGKLRKGRNIHSPLMLFRTAQMERGSLQSQEKTGKPAIRHINGHVLTIIAEAQVEILRLLFLVNQMNGGPLHLDE